MILGKQLREFKRTMINPTSTNIYWLTRMRVCQSKFYRLLIYSLKRWLSKMTLNMNSSKPKRLLMLTNLTQITLKTTMKSIWGRQVTMRTWIRRLLMWMIALKIKLESTKKGLRKLLKKKISSFLKEETLKSN